MLEVDGVLAGTREDVSLLPLKVDVVLTPCRVNGIVTPLRIVLDDPGVV